MKPCFSFTPRVSTFAPRGQPIRLRQRLDAFGDQQHEVKPAPPPFSTPTT